MKKVTIPLLAVLLVATILVAHAGIIISTIGPIPFGQPEFTTAPTAAPAAKPTAAAPAAAPTAAPAAAPTAAPAAAPASIGNFVVTSITCDPTRVIAGSPMKVIVAVKNGGASQGTQTLVLHVDGAEAATKEVTLAAGASDEITFKYQTKTTASPESLGQVVQGQAVAGAPVERDVPVEVGGVTTTFLLIPTPFMPIT